MSNLASPEVQLPLNANPPRLTEGMEIGDRFIIQGRLGAGGNATVYSARDHDTELSAAIKIPRIVDSDTRDRFVREVELTQAFSEEFHGVVPYLDAGIAHVNETAFAYLATQNMSGESLDKAIMYSKPGKLAVESLVEIVSPALHAASEIHDAGLIHRDIKPANIFIDAEGAGKLGDFGIVNTESFEPRAFNHYRIPEEVISEELSRTKGGFGTPAFKGPEHAYTKAGDVFAAGATIYNGLTGKLPLEAPFDFRNYSPPGEEEFDSRVPRNLALLAISCLEIDPAKRPTMHAVAQELETV